jgi:cell division protein FtsB
MTEIDINADLEAVAGQLQKSVEELQELDGKRQQLAQQIQNLNGVAMYLRGKEKSEDTPFTPGDGDTDDKET